jgi:cytoskeletal protein CcmA (bactofilin family)
MKATETERIRMANVASQGQRVQPEPATDARASSFTERRVAAWVGTALRVEGKIISAGDLTIDGNVEGSIELGNHSLTIGSSASVVADLVAKSVTISGTVKGNVMGNAKVDLKSTARVEGDITAPKFAMEDGAVLVGKVDTGAKAT